MRLRKSPLPAVSRLPNGTSLEALRLHGAARTDTKLVRAQRLLDWLKRQTGSPVLFRDLIRRGLNELRAKEPAEAAVNTLVDHGLIVEVGARPRSYLVLEEPPPRLPKL
jgi:hypothetical protein